MTSQECKGKRGDDRQTSKVKPLTLSFPRVGITGFKKSKVSKGSWLLKKFSKL